MNNTGQTERQLQIFERCKYCLTANIVWMMAALTLAGCNKEFSPSCTPMIMNQWMEGSIGTSVKEVWYSFEASRSYDNYTRTYPTYYIWSNDSVFGDGIRTASVLVSAYKSDGTLLFSSVGWDNPGVINSRDYNGTVYLKVVPTNHGGSGKFSIGYSTESIRAVFGCISLTENQWMEGSIGAPDSEVWYSLNIPKNATGSSNDSKTFHIWCNDNVYGDGTKTANVRVCAYKSDGTVLFSSIGWDTPSKISNKNYDQIVYIKVTLMDSDGFGNFAIGYSSVSTRAAFGCTPLTENQWMDGSITSNGELWYSFSAYAYNNYRVWCNDKVNGDGSKTASVWVTAYKSDGTELFRSADWDNPGVISSYSGTVYIKIASINSDGFGNFAIGYSDASIRSAIGSTSLAENRWMEGSITSSNSELWYSLESRSGTCVWCNDKINGDGTKTASVQATAYRYDGTELFRSADWDNPGVISSYRGTVYIKITSINSGNTGTFGIVFSNDISRPPVN